jgi:hypothetical protein
VVDLISDFWQFLRAVFSRWQAYVTGSLLTAIAFVYEHVSQKMIPGNVVLWGIAGFFVTGAFMAWREQTGKVKELNRPTENEVLDDLIVEWEELEELYGGDSVVGRDKLEAAIKNTRTQLRANCRDYVNSFNDSVKNPHPGQGRFFPHRARTMVELGEWMKDKDRVSDWRTTAACLNRLKEIKKNHRV